MRPCRHCSESSIELSPRERQSGHDNHLLHQRDDDAAGRFFPLYLGDSISLSFAVFSGGRESSADVASTSRGITRKGLMFTQGKKKGLCVSLLQSH